MSTAPRKIEPKPDRIVQPVTGSDGSPVMFGVV
jgi:hypothetical protein